MPHYHIHVTSTDGAIDSPDAEGITLDGPGAVRALVVETLVEVARERPRPGHSRTVTVAACDEHGAVIYQDSVTLGDESAFAVSRAIGAMNRTL